MRLSANKLKWFLAMRDQLLEDAREYYKIHNGCYPDETNINEISDETFGVQFIKYHERYSGCYNSDDEQSFDIRYDILYDYDWEQKLQNKLFEENLKAYQARIDKEKQEKKERADAIEAADKANYERLKLKYGKTKKAKV